MNINKPPEFWAVIIGMVLYVATRDAETESIPRRMAKTGASAFLAYGLSPTIAPYVRGSETIAAVGIMAAGLFVLDTMTALVSDREFIKEMIRRRLGGGGGNGDA